jgi:hypothetical protein
VAAGYLLPSRRPDPYSLAAAQTGEPLHFHQRVVTPSGTPLGGSVDVDVWSDGRYKVKFHMHSSSIFGDFDFNLRAYLSAPGFPTLMFLHSGNVSGVDDADHEEEGSNPLIPIYWEQLRTGAAYQVHKDYEWGGIVGGLTGLVADLLDLGAGFVGAALGAIIGATREAIGWLGATLGPGGTLGVVGGVVVFAVGAIAGLPIGAALIVGTITGVGIGAVAEAMIESRPLNDAEIALAWQVFGNSLPYGDVILTNLAGASGRAFCAPGVDGKTYINLGNSYNNPLGTTNSYPVPGQLLVHELTHAWQIAHTSFLPGFMCSALVTQSNAFGDSVYAYDGPGPGWDDFNLEQQGSIVDDWFAATGKSTGFRPMDQGSPYYRYIWTDLLGGNPPTTAPGNLRSSSGLAVSRQVGQLDVFFPTPDGSVNSVWWNQTTTWSAPFSIAGASSASPATVASIARMAGNLDAYWIKPDGSVESNWWASGGNWNAPFTLAGPGSAATGSAPSASAAGGRSLAVTCQSPTHIDVFWIAPDGSVATSWWDIGSGWGSPYTMWGPGSAAGAIAAVGRRPGHLDVFWVAPDGAVVTTWWDASAVGWAQPGPIAPAGSARPTSLGVACRLPEHIDVFYVAPDGSIGTAWWEPSDPGWRAPFTVAGPGSSSGAITANSRFPEHVDVFYVAPDGSVGTAWWEPTDSGWRAPFTLAGPGSASQSSSITAVNQTPLHLDIFWTAPDGAIGTIWWDIAPGWGTPYAITPPGVAAV